MKKILSMFVTILFLAALVSAQKIDATKQVAVLQMPGNPSHPYWGAMPVFPDPVRIEVMNRHRPGSEIHQQAFRGAGLIFTPPTSSQFMIVWVRTRTGLTPAVCRTSVMFQGYPQSFMTASDSNPQVVPVGMETVNGSQSPNWLVLL